jgi:hypothetical protein
MPLWPAERRMGQKFAAERHERVVTLLCSANAFVAESAVA